MTTAQATLPDKMSDLLEMAVEDAQKRGADPLYQLDMAQWHAGSAGTETCRLCMAGAVMSCRLGVERHQRVGPHSHIIDLPSAVRAKLDSIDKMRQGFFREAYYGVGGRPGSILAVQRDAMYAASEIVAGGWCGEAGRATWSAYGEAARVLRDVGL